MLDPAGFASVNGLDAAAFVKEHPIQKELTADIKPLSESSLRELIRTNLREEQSIKKGRGPSGDLDYDGGQGIGR